MLEDLATAIESDGQEVDIVRIANFLENVNQPSSNGI